MLREAVPDGERLTLDGEPLTAEAVRAALRDACRQHGAPAPPDVIVASVWQGAATSPARARCRRTCRSQIDLWPRDEVSGCWADMTRTFVVGRRRRGRARAGGLVRQALERRGSPCGPAITGRELHGLACDVFEEPGFRTQRTGPAEDDPDTGFQFSLGHGVGLRCTRTRCSASWGITRSSRGT